MESVGQPTSLFPWIHIGLAHNARKISSEDIILPNILGKMGIWITLPSLSWYQKIQAKLVHSRFYIFSEANEHTGMLDVWK